MGVKMKLTLDSVRNSPQHMTIKGFVFGDLPEKAVIEGSKNDDFFDAIAPLFVVSMIEGLTESKGPKMFWDATDDTDEKWMVRPLKYNDGIDFVPNEGGERKQARIRKQYMDNLDSIAGCIVMDIRDLPSATIGIIDVTELKRRQLAKITAEEAVKFGFEKAPS
jgi:hypothetical protein